MDNFSIQQLHPLFIHFPIVFLLLTPILKLIYIFTTKFKKESQFLYYAALCIGLISFLISIYLGDIALDSIKETVCDFSLVYEHEDTAYYCLVFFVLALLFEFIMQYLDLCNCRLFHFASLSLLILGTVFLVYTSHLGGTMVYQKGIGVKVDQPKKCY